MCSSSYGQYLQRHETNVRTVFSVTVVWAIDHLQHLDVGLAEAVEARREVRRVSVHEVAVVQVAGEMSASTLGERERQKHQRLAESSFAEYTSDTIERDTCIEEVCIQKYMYFVIERERYGERERETKQIKTKHLASFVLRPRGPKSSYFVAFA